MTKYDWSGLGPREQGVADGRSANEAYAFDPNLGRLSEPARTQAMVAELMATGVAVSAPDDFTMPVPFVVTRTNRTFAASVDVSQFKITGTTYYVGFSGASDSNDGLTKATSFASLTKAYTMTDYDVISVADGVYDRTKCGTWTPTRSHSLVCEDGTAILSAHEKSSALSWSVSSGAAYVSACTVVRFVVDTRYTDAFGDYQRLTLATDAADCAATVGSYYYDSGAGNVYVHLFDERKPDAEVRVYLALSRLTVANALTVYLENIKIEGGSAILFAKNDADADLTPSVYAKNCEFNYSGTTNGVTVQGANGWFQSCKAKHNLRDGFNYHVSGGVTGQWVEVDCEGADNGYDPANLGINNGSTIHDGGQIIRVGGLYHDNDGPNVADVNAAQSWNLGSVAYTSRATSTDTQEANFYADAEMWLDHCTSYGSPYDYVQETSGTVFTRACADLQLIYLDSNVEAY